MMYGCTACKHIYQLEILYAEEIVDEFCPNCGQDGTIVQLGEGPSVTEKDGLFYLVDQNNVMGPYSSPMQAQSDLWAWFGERNAEKEEGINERFQVIQGGAQDKGAHDIG